jgi:hypothetical protein
VFDPDGWQLGAVSAVFEPERNAAGYFDEFASV